MGTEIIHTADTHIGYRQYHKKEREKDFKKALSKVVQRAIEKEVDAVVHAGDLFDRSRPSITALSDLIEELKKLRGEGIEFCTIVGNHDGTSERQWPEFLEDLDLAVYLDSDGYVVNDVCLYGLDYVSPQQRSALTYEFTPSDVDTSFLVGHGLFKPFPHGDWDLNEILAKSNVSFDGVLLGDDHTPQLTQVSEVPVTYPGSTERTAADQREKRGFNNVAVNSDGVSITHETIQTRAFDFIDIELSGGEGLQEVIDEVEKTSIRDECVVIITITGDGKRIASADVERVALRKGGLVVRVNDRREFTDSDREFKEVSFTDPDELVQQRVDGLSIGYIATEFEGMVRDVEEFPQANLKDLSEQKMSELIDAHSTEELVELANASKGVEAGVERSGEESETVEADVESVEKDDQMSLGRFGGQE